MMVNCANCPCVYSVGAVACPQCGSTDIKQQNVAGRSVKVIVGEAGPEIPLPDDAQPVKVKSPKGPKVKPNAGTAAQK